MQIRQDGADLKVTVEGFSLKDTLTCGQCFRWEETEDGSFIGIAGGRVQRISQLGEEFCFYHCTQEEFSSFWQEYFDLSADYGKIRQCLQFDKTLREAMIHTGGIRILKQDPWEVICSFIISQNNNIPRIKGIVKRLCEGLGDPLEGGEYSFPSPDRLAGKTVEDLAFLRAGFRAKYLLDAANKITSGEVDLAKISNGSPEEGEEELRKIYGVGAKVAQCVLLFGFYKLEAFPIDVWMKKVLEKYYPEGFPKEAYPYRGVAQQYLFHYIRKLTKGDF